MRPPELEPGRIDLWLCGYQSIDDPRLLQHYLGLLNPTERERQQRFHFADDRQRYLLTRALVRCVLSRYAAVAPADWRFAENAYGRPAIDPAHDSDLEFNLSHTRGLIALAVARRRVFGIDVENLAERQPSLGIADRFFSAEEAAALAKMPDALQQRRFFEYWTFKEAYIKARGMGLSLPLDRFSFRFPADDGVQLQIDPELNDPAERWQLWQLAPSDSCLLALCAERASAPTLLRARQIIPDVHDEALDLPPLRCGGFGLMA